MKRGLSRLRKVRNAAARPPIPNLREEPLWPWDREGPEPPSPPPTVRRGHHRSGRSASGHPAPCRPPLIISLPAPASPSFLLPISPPLLLLAGSGPGGRVDQAPTATAATEGVSALPGPSVRGGAATHCGPTGTPRALGGLAGSLERPPPAPTGAALPTPKPTQQGMFPVTAMQCHLQAEPRRWGCTRGAHLVL